jgi:pyruvate/2-oxoglutarate dehydrogenase complex dihydrolipoamide dehydrogenase (E3) component
MCLPWTYEQDPSGHLGLLADLDADVLIGAWAVSPLAAEWIHHAAPAIRARIPLDVLRHQLPEFATYNEAYLAALERLRR